MVSIRSNPIIHRRRQERSSSSKSKSSCKLFQWLLIGSIATVMIYTRLVYHIIETNNDQQQHQQQLKNVSLQRQQKQKMIRRPKTHNKEEYSSSKDSADDYEHDKEEEKEELEEEVIFMNGDDDDEEDDDDEKRYTEEKEVIEMMERMETDDDKISASAEEEYSSDDDDEEGGEKKESGDDDDEEEIEEKESDDDDDEEEIEKKESDDDDVDEEEIEEKESDDDDDDEEIEKKENGDDDDEEEIETKDSVDDDDREETEGKKIGDDDDEGEIEEKEGGDDDDEEVIKEKENGDDDDVEGSEGEESSDKENDDEEGEKEKEQMEIDDDDTSEEEKVESDDNDTKKEGRMKSGDDDDEEEKEENGDDGDKDKDASGDNDDDKEGDTTGVEENLDHVKHDDNFKNENSDDGEENTSDVDDHSKTHYGISEKDDEGSDMSKISGDENKARDDDRKKTEEQKNNATNGSEKDTELSSFPLFDYKNYKQLSNELRQSFSDRYDGPNQTFMDIYQKCLTILNSDVDTAKRYTANRILMSLLDIPKNNVNDNAAPQRAEFRMGFGGYSVTVGRGNHFAQSFPFIVRDLLTPIFDALGKSSTASSDKITDNGIVLNVRNAAIGGIPALPYGFCLPNFLGDGTNVFSWDFAMNENGRGELSLESYIRNGLSSLSSTSQTSSSFPKPPPMFIMLDRNKARISMVKHYLGVVPDAIAFSKPSDAKIITYNENDMKEESKPLGFQEWNVWGSPKGSPGQQSWHPKYKEHELMGNILSMYFLDALDIAADILNTNIEWKEDVTKQLLMGADHVNSNEVSKFPLLPKPMSATSSVPPDNDSSDGRNDLSSLLLGLENEDEYSKDSSPNTDTSWKMNRVSCRASFLPQSNTDLHLESSVVSGLADHASSDPLSDRTDEEYQQGWVKDVGKLELDTKRKVEKKGGMGYIDMKWALYGIPASGALELFLPHEDISTTLITTGDISSSDMLVADYFQSLVLCEVNEKRTKQECNLETDVTYQIGGVTSNSVHRLKENGVAQYLKKPLCVHVGIPSSAKVSFDSKLAYKKGRQPEMTMDGNDGAASLFGLLLSIRVTGKVTREDGACSISHVVWENVIPRQQQEEEQQQENDTVTATE